MNPAGPFEKKLGCDGGPAQVGLPRFFRYFRTEPLKRARVFLFFGLPCLRSLSPALSYDEKSCIGGGVAGHMSGPRPCGGVQRTESALPQDPAKKRFRNRCCFRVRPVGFSVFLLLLLCPPPDEMHPPSISSCPSAAVGGMSMVVVGREGGAS